VSRGWLAASFVIGLATAIPSCSAARPPALNVYAASSLTMALDELAPSFTRQSGVRVRASYAATSTLARQIESGAEADVFISADRRWMDYLEDRSRIVTATRTAILGNRLVLVVASDRPATVDLVPGFDLAGLLGQGRLAVGDPAHVPAGRYARQALASLGVWAVAEPRLAPAESVRAALALVERGEVPAGIVYESDAALTTRVRVAGVFPAATHDPVVYAAAIVAGRDRPVARQYLEFLRSQAAGAVFARYRFSVR
jgi:molybdate transport system substrate-binding protein